MTTQTQEQPISKTKLIASYKKEAVRVYEDEKYLIVYPKTYNSMCVYGYGATWCVTSSDEYLFESYSESPMFVIIIKNSKIGNYQEKYLCQFETQGIVDINTEEVGYADFFFKFKELVDVFSKIILEGTYKQYSDFEKEYFVNYLLKARVYEDVDKNPFD